MLEDKNYNNILVQQNNIELTDINETLASLSPEEKEAVLTILKEYAQTGTSKTLGEIETADWDEIPVEIDEFLDNTDYLGKSIWEIDKVTGEKRCTLFPYWRETLHKLFPTNTKTAYNTLILSGSIGIGKEQPISALVLTKNGFVPMGKITVGTKVFGRDGQLHNVIAVFPQGIKDVYEVTFTDGSKTRCGENHLWTVTNHHKKVNGKIKAVTQTLTLKEILKYKLHSSCYNFEIPMCNAMEFQKQTHLISPYLLGLLLGDGCFKGNSVSFCSADQELLDAVNNEISLNEYTLHGKIRNKLFEGYICKVVNKKPFNNIYKDELVRLGLFDTDSTTKFIPQEYLYTSIEERLAILQGLTDTDGCAYHIHAQNGDDHYNTTFSTCSNALKNDFVWLVQSLGGTARVTVKQGKYKDKYGQLHLTKITYVINFFLPSKFKPFRLKRKLDKYNSCQHREPVRYIKEIKKLDYREESQCILLDGEEHLYLTDNFIVTHNTLMACICQLYLLYRMLCLKDPYTYYGLMPMDKITFSMLNVNIETAKGVGWSKLQNMVQASPWFMEHGHINASKVDPQWQPDKHIELIFGSSNNHVIGRALFSNFSDELNFTGTNIEKQKKKLLKLIAQIDARLKSRFAKGTFLPTLNILASSADAENAFLNDYINRKQKIESSTTLVINEPQWVVRNDKGSPDDPGAFWVAIGGKTLAHELLPINATDEDVEKYRAKGYQMIKIPPVFREDFETNLDQALMDIAGVSSSVATKFISGARLTEIKSNLYENPFTKDIIEVGNAPDDYLQYANFFDLSKVNEQDKARPLFMHLDMSLSGDKTGIAGVWIMGKKPTKEGEDPSKELYYKLAFSVSIKAPKGYQVSFEKNRNFIRWLRDRGFNIKAISSDTFQSANLIQELKKDGFNTQIISVDRVNSEHVCLPYTYLKALIYEHKLVMYSKCDLLTDELVGLERMSNGRIDHTIEGINSKDQADAFCLDGNTKIFLTSGNYRTIADLYTNGFKNEYVLAYDISKQMIIAEPISDVIYMGKKDTIKLTLDNNEELICTPDHKLLARNGEYIEAKNALNISLMPFNYEQKLMYKNRDYTYIYIPKNDLTNKGIYLHTLIAEQYHNKDKLSKETSLQKNEWVVIHHKDINRLNNNPDNLEYLTNTEHSKVHTALNSTPEKRKQLREAGKKNYKLYNHRVIKIEPAGVRDVYDIKLANIHNFALTTGIFVHNCGSCWLASQFANEYSYEYGDNLEASIAATMYGITDNTKKTKLIEDFQSELLKAYNDTFEELEQQDYETKQKQKEQLEYYQNIKNGIIIF